METSVQRSSKVVKKRSPNACMRCRQQKIRCSGSLPCHPCAKRRLVCTFDDSTKKILVTRGYIRDLQEKALPTQQEQPPPNDGAPSLVRAHEQHAAALQEDVNSWLGNVSDMPQNARETSRARDVEIHHEASSSPSAQLMNPFALDDGNYMADNHGRSVYLGMSSNWSFGRRVLRMTCERLKIQLPTERLHFEGAIYSLDWDHLRVASRSQECLLPSADHAIYLINAVKFHCGQMFHLFDEAIFMRHFSTFYDNHGNVEKVPHLWYIHYLLIIAFGRAFVGNTSRNHRPAGADLFLEAMRRLPEITFFSDDQIEAIEILVCAALYLQCLDFRSLAYNLIGQAVRKSLEQGMHTKMSSQDLSQAAVERCRKAWWTVYMLDRQMSSLMGVPLAIRDEDISAKLPSFVEASQKTICLELHVKLSRVIADIMNTVYSTEGRIARRYLASTKQALKNIANVTSLLKENVELPDHQSMSGISRLSAYLHLLHYQCICLTTRPLAYSFLERRLKSTESSVRYSLPRESIRILLRTCVESAQQMLHILTSLQNQGLLETFLPFDLEAVFNSAMILMMTSAIDSSLLDDHSHWSHIAYSLLDDMALKGNMIAATRRQELQQLATVLSHVPALQVPLQRGDVGGDPQTTPNGRLRDPRLNGVQGGSGIRGLNDGLFDDPIWQDEVSAEQLMLLADNLDLDGLDWVTSSLADSSVPSQGFSVDT